MATSYFGPDLYGFVSSIGCNNGLHRVVDEIRPQVPIALGAGGLHTNEKTPRMPVKVCVCQQVFYFAIAKQGFGIAVHVLFRRHAKWP